jgi:hypothetical protein
MLFVMVVTTSFALYLVRDLRGLYDLEGKVLQTLLLPTSRLGLC